LREGKQKKKKESKDDEGKEWTMDRRIETNEWTVEFPGTNKNTEEKTQEPSSSSS
jgi:hypothetical protein